MGGHRTTCSEVTSISLLRTSYIFSDSKEESRVCGISGGQVFVGILGEYFFCYGSRGKIFPMINPDVIKRANGESY